MVDNRKSGLALIIGMIGTIITMAFHPTGNDLLSSGQFSHVARIGVAVHALALICLPIIFLGCLGLYQRLAAPDRLSLAALVMYGFAAVAVMNAATLSGLVAPGVARHMLAGEPGSRDMWSVAFHLSGDLNQAFAMVFVVASSSAILLWSISILRSGIFSRALGIYGCFVAPLTLIAVLSGHIRLNVHGFGMVVLGQAIWFISGGVLLWSEKQELDAKAT
ncbi:MAG TPA: hypothetical protein VGK01_03610 [Candidatus Angelobacter sp.]|jgi:hypothetical protein